MPRPFRSVALTALVLVALVPPAAAQTPAVPAFPGAEGAGAATRGGRGGRIVAVTTLADAGPGSLRAALAVTGPKTVVFRVGGTIELVSPLFVTEPFVTLAGQTAPGGGILLSAVGIDQAPLLVLTHEVILRFLRIRTGRGPGYVFGAGDVIAVGEGSPVHNIVFDHLSLSWGNDENLSVWTDVGGARNITFQDNLIAEALAHDNHSTGLIVGTNTLCDDVSDVDIVRNVFAHNGHRNPYVKVRRVRVVNNVVYNWRYMATQLSGGLDADLVGNVYVPGVDSGSRSEIVWRDEWDGCNYGPPGPPSLHVRGNVGPHQPNPAGEQWTTLLERVGGGNGWGYPGSPPVLTRLPRLYERAAPLPGGLFPVTVRPAGDIEALLLPDVGASRRLDADGAWVPNRDAVDLRLADEVRTRTGRLRLTEADAGGYPAIAPGVPYPDADGDAMADAWEARFGLDPADPSDGPLDADGDGYTNAEAFLNGTAPRPVAAEALPAAAASLRVAPTPAGAAASVALALPAGGAATVDVFDALGRRVARIHDGALGAGTHAFRLDTSRWPAGVYVVRAATAGGTLQTRLVRAQ